MELLWDLVFVFAITQVSSLLSRDLGWAGFGRSMLVLALVWWAWSAFVWAANAQTADVGHAARVPAAVDRADLHHRAGAPRRLRRRRGRCSRPRYALVRLLHLALYADASRQGNASWKAIAGFGVTV